MDAVIIVPQKQFDDLVNSVQSIKSHLESKGIGSAYDDLINEEQLQKKIGKKLSRTTIWRYVKSGRLNQVQIGGRKMYRLSEVISMNTTGVRIKKR